MRLVELIGCRVIDAEGDDVGGVHDVRLRAVTVDGHETYRVIALVVGDVSLATRLGYGRQDLQGPWPLPQLFGRLARRSRLVEWDDIVEIARPRITISRRRDDLESAVEINAPGPEGSR